MIWKIKALTSINPDPHYEVQQYILFFFLNKFLRYQVETKTRQYGGQRLLSIYFYKLEMETVTLKY